NNTGQQVDDAYVAPFDSQVVWKPGQHYRILLIIGEHQCEQVIASTCQPLMAIDWLEAAYSECRVEIGVDARGRAGLVTAIDEPAAGKVAAVDVHEGIEAGDKIRLQQVCEYG